MTRNVMGSLTIYNHDMDSRSSSSSLPNGEALKFSNEVEGDIFSFHQKCTIQISIYDFLMKTKEFLNQKIKEDVKIESYSTSGAFLRGGNNVFVSIYYSSSNRLRSLEYLDIWKAEERNIGIKIFGGAILLREFLEKFLKDYKMGTMPSIYWNYTSDGSLEDTQMELVKPRQIFREFYPWLNEEPSEYIDRFLKSDSGLILLRGEPGTGKTSFIHTMIWQSGVNSMITYETELFEKDQLFVNFMTHESAHFLVMEDADALITSREREGNKVMNKFLNASDGLIRFPNKKLIISANIMDNNRIDSAMLRPGRCFDAPFFKRLTYKEACRAAEVAGIKMPTENKEYSLAELFSQSKGGPSQSPESPRSVGFGSR